MKDMVVYYKIGKKSYEELEFIRDNNECLLGECKMIHNKIRRTTWKRFVALLLVVSLTQVLVACNKKEMGNSPITITLWHVYGEQTNSPLNDMIDTFNETVGRDKGIRVQVNVVSNTSDIHESVLRAANHEPGAGELPDMFISYPKTVLALPDKDILVDYHDYFSEDELSDYIPEFIEEGEIDGKLMVFPIAKSTEILFVNKTIFDRFAAETNVSLSDLSTWEGLFDVSHKYYEWTDAQTPDVLNDGKAFFVHDYHFNYYQVGVASLGQEFFENDGTGIKDSEALHRIFGLYAQSAINGDIWLGGGFATEALRTGDVVCSVASSASVLYYDDYVSYPDNTKEQVEFISMPVPVFEGGDKLVMQRGAGFCTVKSTPQKEKAACVFLEWLTNPENNVSLVTSLGYMPVTNEAFDMMPEKITTIESPKYKSLYEAFVETQKNYKFYSAPKYDNYLSLETKVESFSRSKMLAERDNLRSGTKTDIDYIIDSSYEELLKITP